MDTSGQRVRGDEIVIKPEKSGKDYVDELSSVVDHLGVPKDFASMSMTRCLDLGALHKHVTLL